MADAAFISENVYLFCASEGLATGVRANIDKEGLAKEMNVQFLGSIPLDVDACMLGDTGKPIVLEKPNCEVTNAFKSIVSIIQARLQLD